MKTTYLKPCPFCGGKAQLINSTEIDGYYHYEVAYVECECCLAKSKSFIIDGYYGTTTKEEHAINAWNMRAEEVK